VLWRHLKGIRVRILHSDEDHPTTRGTLENLDLISQVTQQPIRNSWGVFDSHSTDLPPAIFTRTSTLTLYLLDSASTSS
jgi:hypothetical protein